MADKLGGKSASQGVAEKFPSFPVSRGNTDKGKVGDTGKVPFPNNQGGGKNPMTGSGKG